MVVCCKMKAIKLHVIFFFQAAILQQTSDYIQQLESDKTRLLAINNQLSTQLKRLLGSDYEKQISVNYNPSPPTKRKKRDTGMLCCNFALFISVSYGNWGHFCYKSFFLQKREYNALICDQLLKLKQSLGSVFLCTVL